MRDAARFMTGRGRSLGGRSLVKRTLGGGLVALLFAGIAVSIVSLGYVSVTDAQTVRRTLKPEDKRNPLPEIVSGYYFANAETRALQDDDFDNPGFLWVEAGEQLWKKKDGSAGKACASCHKRAKDSMKGVAATYPKFYKPKGKLINLVQRINECRTQNLKAKPWKYESNEMLSMSAYVAHQSRGVPLKVAVDGPEKPFFEKGKAYYYKRRGQFNIACNQCHEGHYGNKLRADLLSQGHANGFPTYRLKWQKLGSLHRRLQICSSLTRARVLPKGSDTYVNLELYLKWRGNGLPIEVPAVRR